jgi:MerR family transcriptional regulator, thiopeptide resistance regulator
VFTVSQLARQCGLSRTTLLYYESIGLIAPPRRSGGNYRCYGQADLTRLKEIRAYRDAGLKLGDIRAILDRPKSGGAGVLRRRLLELDVEIGTLRAYQQAILKLLEQNAPGKGKKGKMITKEKWVSIMKASGLTSEQMNGWHTEFERSAPEEHQEFLEFLHIDPEEIRTIRDQCRKKL